MKTNKHIDKPDKRIKHISVSCTCMLICFNDTFYTYSTYEDRYWLNTTFVLDMFFGQRCVPDSKAIGLPESDDLKPYVIVH